MKQGILTALSVGRYGRFCNGAWIIASVLGIARKNQLEPLFPLWRNWDAEERFGSKEDCDLYRHFVYELPRVPDGIQWRDYGVGWGFQEIILPPGNWNITGHLQSPAFFRDVTDTVQHYFRMIDEPPIQDVVGLHYRAQDYDQGTNAGYHPRMSLAYYEPAMAQFGNDQKFLVFSDDIPGAKGLFRPLEGKHKIAYSEGLDYIQDFRRLKRCASFIIANSSYSAMAAILGDHPDKQVVCPTPWFGKAAAPLTGEDIYDRGWTIVNYETGEIATKA